MNSRTTSNPIPYGQQWLLNKFAGLGFNQKKLTGICYGLAETAAHIIMIDQDVVRFNQLVQFISDTPDDEFKVAYQSTHERYRQIAKTAKEKALAELRNDELMGKALHVKHYKRHLIELALQAEPTLSNYLLAHALFDEIEIFHSLMQHKDVAHNNYATQSTANIVFDWLINTRQLKENGIEMLDSFSSHFRQRELQQLLTALETIIKQEKINYSIRFGLSSVDHRASLIYLPNKGWAYADANKMPVKIITSAQELADEICSSFNNDDSAAIAVETYSFRSHADEVKKILTQLKNTEAYKQSRQLDLFKINKTDDAGNNWLMIAANSGDSEAVKALLTGVQPSIMNSLRQFIRPSFQLKANPNHTNNEGANPLSLAIIAGSLASVNALLEYGADANGRCKGIPPLEKAAYYGHYEISKSLIAHGADVNGASFGFTALTNAIQNNELALTQLLLDSGADINYTDTFKRSYIQIACEANASQDILKFLLERGANPNVKDNIGMTPLYKAVINDNLANVEILLKHGANANEKYDKSVLEIACERNQLAIVKTLLEHHADTKPTYFEYNPLLIAAKNNHTEIVNLLLKNGCDVNCTNILGESPLFLAIRNKNETIVRLLLAHGANRYQWSYAKSCPIDEAQKTGNQTIIAMLNSFSVENNCSNSQETCNANVTNSANNHTFNENFINAKNNLALHNNPLLFNTPTSPIDQNAESPQMTHESDQVIQLK